MGLLIPGLNLPKDKPVTLFITSNKDVYLEGVLLSGKAVPIPPHGRLIDADELAAMCDEPHWCAWLSDIDNAPTVIPAEPPKEDKA